MFKIKMLINKTNPRHYALPELPNSALSISKNLWKKGMGVSTFAHPWSQAFALPPVKDKQRSQPTPSRIIKSTHSYTSNI